MSEWIPLLDYAVRKGVSLSTLRRHIKANKIQYRIENGRYLVLSTEAAQHSEWFESDEPRDPQTESQVRELNTRLQQAQEEIAELKTLIALYEEKIPTPTLSS